MSRLAIIFPGQGAQYPGMARDMYDSFACSRTVFDQASLGLGRDVRKLCWESDAATLAETANAQPGILAASAACLAPALEAGVQPTAYAGLSLGEYTALVAAGSIGLGEAMRLVSVRARLMQEAIPQGQGAMAAVIGLGRHEISQICSLSSRFGVVEAANYNAPDQIVISGHAAAVEAAAVAAKEAGARRVIPLAVSAPFHCSLLRSVEAEFAAALASASFDEPLLPVIANTTARPVRQPASIRWALTTQISSPVMWQDSVEYLAAELGVDTFLEIGPGKVLSRFVNKIQPDALTLSIEDPRSLDAALAALSERGLVQ